MAQYTIITKPAEQGGATIVTFLPETENSQGYAKKPDIESAGNIIFTDQITGDVIFDFMHVKGVHSDALTEMVNLLNNNPKRTVSIRANEEVMNQLREPVTQW